MVNKQQIVTDILISIPILGIFYTIFVINSDLGNGIVSGKYFWFYASMVLLSVIAIPAAIVKCKERVQFRFIDLLFILFCCLAVRITLSHSDRLTSKCLLLICLVAFYFYLRIFLSDKSKYLLVLFFMLTGLVEVVWGLRQLFGLTTSQHYIFKITGSFFNPGPYSGWLAMVFPMALWYAIHGFTKKVPKGKLVFNRQNITAYY